MTQINLLQVNEGFSLSLGSEKILKKILLYLVIINASLVLLDLVFNYSGFVQIGSIRRLFNMAREDSLAAWYSSVLLLMVSFAAWLVYARMRELGWAAIAAFFTYLAVDDGSGLHERVGTAAKTLLKARALASESGFAFPSYTWHLVYGPFFGGMALFMLYYLLKELKSLDLKILFIAALSCFGTAEFFDFVEGMDGAFIDISFALGTSIEFVSHYSRIAEEFLENLGATLFLVCFLSYFFKNTREVNIKIAS